MRKKHTPAPLNGEDKAFFLQFYNENIKFMYYIARKYTTDSSDIEDLVQEALMRLMNNISSLRQINRCKTAKYIVLTIKTAYLDIQRYRQKENVILVENDTLEELFIENHTFRDSDQTLAANNAVAKLKAELPAREWAIIEGKYLLGLSQEELAQVIGVSSDSVRMALHRAREKAKNLLRDDFVKGGDRNG